MPVTRTLDNAWYDTPNIHLCTVRDFEALCREMNILVERRVAVNGQGSPIAVDALSLVNLLAAQAVYLLKRR